MTLTTSEASRLAELEGVIQRGLSNFIEVGEALAEIRDTYSQKVQGHQRWEAIGYTSFEDYCKRKWGLSYRHAFQVIESAKAALILKTCSTEQVPQSERQARPLTKLETPEQQREAWEEAVATSKTGKPTAKEVEVVVERKMRPLPETKFTEEAEAAVEEAEKDSETLWLLKSYWKKATKKDRKAFLAWAENQ